MGKKSNKKNLIALVGDGYFAVRRKTTDVKLELKKYSRKLRKHVVCSEKKLST